jgi:GT2 family glycosyltransferase
VNVRLPDISVVVPTRDRPSQLARCLAALAALDYPRDRYEVIVVDDGGLEPVEPVVRRSHGQMAVKVVRRENGGPSVARNTGAAAARGSLLAFTDDDCRPTPDWLARLAGYHAVRPDVALGGETRNGLDNNPFSVTTQLIMEAGYARHNGDPTHARFVTASNLAVLASEFEAVGGFNPRFRTSEDREFCDRWIASGRFMHFLPDVVVYHDRDLTLRGFVAQHFAYGRGAWRFHGEHASRSGERVRIEPSFYLGLHRRAFAAEGIARVIVLQLLLVVFHAANLTGFLWEGWVSRRT